MIDVPRLVTATSWMRTGAAACGAAVVDAAVVGAVGGHLAGGRTAQINNDAGFSAVSAKADLKNVGARTGGLSTGDNSQAADRRADKSQHALSA